MRMRPVFLCAVAALVFLLPPQTAGAAVVRKETYKKVEEINSLLEKEKYDKSLSVLEAVDKSRLNRYEKNLFLNMKAHIYFQSGKTGESLKIYRELLRSRGVTEQFRRGITTTVAGIYFSEGKYRQALDFLDEHIKSPLPSDTALRGFCFYRLGDYAQSATLMEKAIKGSKKPPENWLIALQSSYKEMEMAEKRLKTVERLAGLYPARRNLLLLSSLYAQSGQPDRQMAVLKLIYEAGNLKKEKYLVLLSRLMFNRGLFLEAARVVDEGMRDGKIEKTVENFEFLSRAYMRAREPRKAVAPLEDAVKTADDNKPCIELADVYRILEEWKKAVSVADKCLAQPASEETHRLYVIKGQAFFNLGDFGLAEEQFTKARNFKKSETVAIRWILYLESEKKRRERLSEAGIKLRRPVF
ncbi:tetratricopeptide repeat protein [Candidatus Mycalebacterium sp.]